MFGSFAEEQQPVRYGVFPRINSINPIKVYCHGYYRLFQQVKRSNRWRTRLLLLIKPPIWAWKQQQEANDHHRTFGRR